MAKKLFSVGKISLLYGDKYFTDANVGVAYTFYPDKFHLSFKEKIDNTESIGLVILYRI